MPHNPDDFKKLYDAVTASLRSFAKAGKAAGQVSSQEVLWFEYLILGFLRQFGMWATPTYPEIKTYLNLFDRGHTSRPVRIAGHAFLHVGYDLPRVLADSMAAFSIPRSRLRTLFLRPSPIFREMFLAQARSGTFGLLARPLGFVKPMEVLAYWMLSLRSVAWIHAEILADALPHVRKTQEQNLAQALLDTGRTATKSFWVFRVPKLDNSQFFQVAPLPLIVGDARFAVPVVAATLAALIVRARNESVSARIAWMGQHFSVVAPKHMANLNPERRTE